jgi:hypothetical protein
MHHHVRGEYFREILSSHHTFIPPYKRINIVPMSSINIGPTGKGQQKNEFIFKSPDKGGGKNRRPM